MWSEPLKTWGFYHILGLVVAISMLHVGTMLGKKYKYSVYKDKIIRVLGIVGLVLLVLELFKQIFNVCIGNWAITQLPYQICSMDMYVLLILQLVKNEKIKKYLVGFVSYVSLTAAVFYFVKPAAALNASYVILSLHSYIWHWTLIAVGTFCMTSFDLHKKEEWKSVLGTLCVFAILVVIAIILNEIFNAVGQTVNFFYINSKEPTFYPLLTAIFKPDPKPYPLYIIVFILYFSIGSLTFYGLAILQKNICEKIRNK